jgi:hypothetical protein
MSNHIVEWNSKLRTWLTRCGFPVQALQVERMRNNGGHFCPACHGQPTKPPRGGYENR